MFASIASQAVSATLPVVRQVAPSVGRFALDLGRGAATTAVQVATVQVVTAAGACLVAFAAPLAFAGGQATVAKVREVSHRRQLRRKVRDAQAQARRDQEVADKAILRAVRECYPGMADQDIHASLTRFRTAPAAAAE